MSRSKYRNLEERLLANSVAVRYPDCPVEGDCWDWWGHIDKDGYGRINIWELGLHLKKRAHRVSYQEFKGVTLGVSEEIDHKCRNRRCINPDHMEPVSGVENLRRMKAFWRNYYVTGRKEHPREDKEAA